MAATKDSPHSRVFSLFSIGSNSAASNASKSNEDLNRSNASVLRPLPSARGDSPNPQTSSNQESRSSRSLREESTEQTNAPVGRHNRLPSLAIRSSSSMHNLNSMSLSPAAHKPGYQAHNFGHSSSPVQPYGLPLRQSPAGTPTYSPHSATLTSMPGDDILLPPPKIRDGFPERPTSSNSDRGRNKLKGRSASQETGSPGSRGSSPASGLELPRPTTPSEGLLTKKRSWRPGRLHKKAESGADNAHSPQAWVVSPQGNIAYDISHLVKAQPVAELWDETGNTFVHLFTREAGLGPSFKIDSALIASSRSLTTLAHGGLLGSTGRQTSSRSTHSAAYGSQTHLRQKSLDIPGMNSRTSSTSHRNRSSSITTSSDDKSEGSRPVSDIAEDLSQEIHLYMPLNIHFTSPGVALSYEEVESLVTVRNLFASLVGQVLVGTAKQPSIFPIFLNIARLLHQYGFTNLDGSTLGEIPSASFVGYTRDLRLDDVRTSREKTLEAIVLGERMKSWALYNEGFVHGVGKWDDLVNFGSLTFSLISNTTRSRMEKASMDLSIRLKAMRARLEDFEVPSLFAGVAASSSGGKTVDFKAWRMSFAAMRKHTMSLYKHRYGSWPPKAKSKKNDFEESGLNRILLRELYHDFSDLYDMLVDRTALTIRSSDMPAHDPSLSADTQTHALRRLLSEFDRSSPPVQPPIPYDIPRLPDLSTTRRDFESLPQRKQARERGKKLKDDEINMALMQSYNRDSVKVTPFLEAFMAFERATARGKSMDEICEIRIGQWIFMYIVLQSLPLVVVDAPGVRQTHGVEYFLCEVPKGSPPWVKEETGRKKAYYRVAGGAGVVSLPADVVDHGVEGIYRRSHCWQVAEKWAGQDDSTADSPALVTREDSLSAVSQRSGPFDFNFWDGSQAPLQPPQQIDLDGLGSDLPGSRPNSISTRSTRNSVALGLEALPLPPGVVPSGFSAGPLSTSTPDPSRSFENILGPPTPTRKKR